MLSLNKRIFLLFLSLALVSGCPEPTNTPLRPPLTPPPLPKAPQKPDPLAVPIRASDLENSYGFKIPPFQEKGDKLPPQPGMQVFGQTVRGGPNQDTNWTAFTLVLFKDAAGYKVLTQMRAIPPVGVIETAGGHLVGGQNWRDGARDELMQEAGISVKNEDLVFLSGAQPRLSKTNNLYGNTNFFVVFNKMPVTSDDNNEIDKNYGHKWLDLKSTYEETQEEKARLGFNHGKYYSFFRGMVIDFCTNVISCDLL